MRDPFRPDLLRGHATVITGGGSGLGRSTALRLAGLGAKVAVLGRRAEPLRETAEAIRAQGGVAAAVPCDVRDPVAVQGAFDAVEAELGAAVAGAALGPDQRPLTCDALQSWMAAVRWRTRPEP